MFLGGIAPKLRFSDACVSNLDSDNDLSPV